MVRILIVIFRNLLNDEKVIQSIADSYPVRKAAQLLIRYCYKHKPKALEYMETYQLQGLKLTEVLKKIAEELEKKKKELK